MNRSRESDLLAELPVPVPEGLVDEARVLDGFYIPTRYPNGHPSGAPYQHFGLLQSEDALRHAGSIVAFARAAMVGP